MSLSDAKLYLVAPERLAAGRLAELVHDLAGAGVDVIQLREKKMQRDELVRASAEVLEACRAVGIPFVVNDYPDIAAEIGADGVHVGQDDVPVPSARRTAGGFVGLSTHSPQQIVAAEPIAPDYIAVGPLFETPTKPGRPATGLDIVGFAAEHAPMPWFAIGGIDASNVGAVVAAGARRIVVVRAITEADDPAAAAVRLKASLPG